MIYGVLKMSENKTISLDSLTREQLVNLIINMQNTNRQSEIRIADIKISSVEGLEVCFETLNNLITKHKDFLISKKESRKNILISDMWKGAEDDI